MSTTDSLSRGGRSHAAAARVARAVRIGDPEAEAEARRDLAAHKIQVAIEKALAVAPPLNNRQIHTLTGLLRSGGAR